MLLDALARLPHAPGVQLPRDRGQGTVTHTQRTHLAHAPDAEDREVVQETTGMTDPAEADDSDEVDDAEGGSGTAGPETAEKDQAGSYARDAEQDPDGERHDRADSDR